MVDWLSKGMHFIPLRHLFIANSVVKTFIENMAKSHEIPRSIVTNQVESFIRYFWQELFGLQGSKLKASFSYHLQTNEQIAMVNRILEQYLMCYCYEEQNELKDYILWVEYWYNMTQNAFVNISPFEIVYGKPPLALATYKQGTTCNEEVKGTHWLWMRFWPS